MKITVIGGGGVRSMFLAKSLIKKAKELKFTNVAFMDTCEEKLNIYGKMAAQVARRIDDSIPFFLTSDAIEAIKDADYIITTIRVGGDDMRVADEKAALELGLLGQETTGAAGFSFAMRSVPALIEYCEIAKKYAKPKVKIFNFTNPAGVVSQTLRDLGYDFCYGICDAPSGLLHSFAKLYKVKPEEVEGECYGLNHLSFFKSIKLNGQDITHELLENDEIYKKTDMRFFDKKLVNHFKCILNEYLYYYFYRQEAIQNILNAHITRGEVISQINKRMTKELSKIDIDKKFDDCIKIFEREYGQRDAAYMSNETGKNHKEEPFKFDIYSPDEGGYAGVAMTYIEAEVYHTTKEMIMCVPNNGAIEGLEENDVVEISCTVDDSGHYTHAIGKIDPLHLEIIRRVKMYERLASQAIREKSKKKAIDSLMVHPLVNSYTYAAMLVDKYIELNAEYTKGWK